MGPGFAVNFTMAQRPQTQSVESGSSRGLLRQTVEFLVALGLCVVVFRTFAAEAYVVPTGSMAQTLLGFHEESTCHNCGFRMAVGVDEDHRPSRPVCPNCGQDRWDRSAAVHCQGDRLLVQKYLYEFRAPRRWEVVVFQSPIEPTQPYVKRIVGLPGESIQIVAGDVLIDGKIARKSLAEQHAMRVKVYDQNFPPKDSSVYPRWKAKRGAQTYPLPTGWKVEGAELLREPKIDETLLSRRVPDWIEYLHWQPDRSEYGPIRDYYPYNGRDLRSENNVEDLMFEADVAVAPEAEALYVRIHGATGRHLVRIPIDHSTEVEVRREGRLRRSSAGEAGVSSSPSPDAKVWHRLVVSTIDRRLMVLVDGNLLFDPIDDDEAPGVGKAVADSPVAVGVSGGGWVRVKNLQIYRDIYYTNALMHAPRRPFAVDRPYHLSEGEFFVLGDNSPVSNDSRFWPNSPVVRAESLLGKPFLVHLPSQVVPLKVFGREVYWIPDPREIRYIH